MALTKEQILAADDLPREEVQVPEWGGSVWIQAMDGTARDAWEAEVFGFKGDDDRARPNKRASLVVRCLADENGKRLFSDEEILEVGSKHFAILERLAAVALRVNGLGKEDVEEAEKNSEADPSGDSTSA